MLLTGLTFIAAVAISLTAAYFSIAGLAAIFAAAFWPVVIMGSVLEVGKLVGATWLHLNWRNPRVSFLHKTYLTFAVLALMLITAIGIYGFLSKGHLEQQQPIAGLELQIDRLAFEQQQLESVVAQGRERIKQLDSVVKTLVDTQRIRGAEGATAVLSQQQAERQDIQNRINSSFARINAIQNELLPLKNQSIAVEAKLGPVKYVAALMGWNDSEAAIRAIILVLMFAFDPLAVVLVISSAVGLQEWKLAKERKHQAKEEHRRKLEEERIQAEHELAKIELEQRLVESRRIQKEAEREEKKKEREEKKKVKVIIDPTAEKKKRRSPRRRNPVTGELEPRDLVIKDPEIVLPIANSPENVAEYQPANEPERPRVRIKAVSDKSTKGST